MNNRTKIRVDSMQERTDRLELEKNLNILKRLAIDVHDLTNGEIIEVDFKAVCEWLSKKTGFPSAEASANLLGKPEEYQRLKKQHKTSKKYIVFEKGTYKAIGHSKEQIREDNTTYLNDEDQQSFNKLEKLARAMTGVGPYINTIEQKTTGEWICNPQKVINKGWRS